MTPRPLGDTGLRVTPLGLGLAALGRPGYINLGHDADLGPDKSVEALRTRVVDVLDAAWTAGVRYFDAARSYGRAEAFLAHWVAERDVKAAILGSKWGYRYTAGWRVDADVHEVKEHTLAHFEAQWAESRGWLGPQLRLYQVHSATLSSGLFDQPDLLDALARRRDAGMVIGLSVSGPGQSDTLRRAFEIERGGHPLFQTVQATWNLLEPSAGPALIEARQRGVGVIIKEALANGRLTDRNDAPALAPLRARAAQQARGTDAVALAAVLALPFVDVVLSGAATRAHLQSNLDALTIPPDDAEAVRLLVPPEAPADYWAARSKLAWT